jgi:hypothetical protein
MYNVSLFGIVTVNPSYAMNISQNFFRKSSQSDGDRKKVFPGIGSRRGRRSHCLMIWNFSFAR